jgi:hypothetical protein
MKGSHFFKFTIILPSPITKVTLVLVVIYLIPVISKGQSEVFQKNSKYGVKSNNEVVLKPKYDSIKIADPNIITAYKGKNSFYFRNNGELLTKGKIGTSPFQNGIGLIKNKRDEFDLILSNGNYVYEDQFYLSSESIGSATTILRSKKISSPVSQYLYFNNEQIASSFDSVSTIEEYLVTHKSSRDEENTMTFFDSANGQEIEKNITRLVDSIGLRLFFTSNDHFNVHDTMGNKLEKNVSKIKDKRGLRLLYTSKYKYTLLQGNEYKLCGNVFDLEFLDPTYFVAKSGDQTILWRMEDYKEVFRDDIILYEFEGPLIYTYKKTENEHYLTTYKKTGEILAGGVKINRKLEGNRFVKSDNQKVFISDYTGKQLSPKFDGIGDEKNGLRIVYSKNN